MRSLQSKFLALTVGCVLLSALALGYVGFIYTHKLVNEDSAQFMNLFCEDKAEEINATLTSIEQSVNMIQDYTIEQYGELGKNGMDKDNTDVLVKKVQEVALHTVKNTEGSRGVYMRVKPELAGPQTGFFWYKDENGEVTEDSLVDFSKYAQDDKEHVDWYYEALEKEEAFWMEPYDNKNKNDWIISYVVPIYRNEDFIGVLGMDIDMALLKEKVDSVQIYESGYAFLAGADYVIYYHRDYPEGLDEENTHGKIRKVLNLLYKKGTQDNLVGYNLDGIKKKMTARQLENGMFFVVTAPAKEINASSNRIIRLFLVSTLSIMFISVLITIHVTREMTRPLKELTEAAQKVAGGDLEVNIDCESKDEVGVLADSVQQMVNHLRHYIDYVNEQAYTDALTGVANKAAYKEYVDKLDKRAADEKIKYAVVVMDINNLKKINDNFGHEFGDMLIRDASRLIQKGFKDHIVYRIGGDEFVIIIEQAEKAICDELLRNFDDGIVVFNKNNTKYEQKIQIARGIAFYEPDCIDSFASVFREADHAMYENKVMQKSMQTAPPAAGQS